MVRQSAMVGLVILLLACKAQTPADPALPSTQEVSTEHLEAWCDGSGRKPEATVTVRLRRGATRSLDLTLPLIECVMPTVVAMAQGATPQTCVGADNSTMDDVANACIELTETTATGGILSVKVAWDEGNSTAECNESFPLRLGESIVRPLSDGTIVEARCERVVRRSNHRLDPPASSVTAVAQATAAPAPPAGQRAR